MRTPFTIPGAEGEPILGDTHRPGPSPPERSPRGVVIIAHGFKGYKDYGMFPRIAQALAEAGLIAHRFNFSHSGMTNRIETFQRPDLFERDTWNKQVFDLRAVVEAMGEDRIAGGGLPCVLFGHSRGGAAALLAAGRFADDDRFPQPAGIVSASAPDSTCNLSAEEREIIRRNGSLDSPSSRTGQTLRVGRGWLREMEEDPAGHDLLAHVARIRCPLLVIHGGKDFTVPVECAERIAAAHRGNARVVLIEDANHVFNTRNPFPEDGKPSPQLERLLSEVIEFTNECCQVTRLSEAE